MGRFVTNGERMKVTLAEDNVKAGTLILVGDKVVAACESGNTGDTIQCQTDGVWEEAAAGAIGQGENVKFDNATKQFSLSGAGEAVHGYSTEAAAGGFVKVNIG
ncbi:DUF2190 family protein [Bdellovibrio bacteriovorus]|uniref:DUF2190 family protein n=1 Tax=Bdellovibrio bacteriovorus TaxID=959 RepID=UPI0035A68558